MFSELSELIEKANEEYKRISLVYEENKENKNISFKERINNELAKMTSGVSLSKYVPTKFNNDVKLFQREHEEMNTNFEKETETIKQELYRNLFEIINNDHSSTTRQVKEMYKIINKCNTKGGCPYHICRVYFSLINTHDKNGNIINIGDPIRIEWLEINGKSRDVDDRSSVIAATNYIGDEGETYIPYMNEIGSVIEGGKFFVMDELEQSVQNNWMVWLSKNKPT